MATSHPLVSQFASCVFLHTLSHKIEGASGSYVTELLITIMSLKSVRDVSYTKHVY